MSGILLVDDEREFVDLVAGFLDDVEVRHASTVAEAMSSMREKPPDVVLLDLSLEREDGMDLLPQLAEHSELSPIPVIAFSVHDSRFEEARRKGAAGCLRKPFRGKELRAALRPFMEESSIAVGSLE